MAAFERKISDGKDDRKCRRQTIGFRCSRELRTVLLKGKSLKLYELSSLLHDCYLLIMKFRCTSFAILLFSRKDLSQPRSETMKYQRINIVNVRRITEFLLPFSSYRDVAEPWNEELISTLFVHLDRDAVCDVINEKQSKFMDLYDQPLNAMK